MFLEDVLFYVRYLNEAYNTLGACKGSQFVPMLANEKGGIIWQIV